MSSRRASPNGDPLWWRHEVQWHVGQREWQAALMCVEEAATDIDDPWMASYVADALIRGAAAAAEGEVELAAHRLGWRFRPTLRRLAAWLTAAADRWPTVAEQALAEGYEGDVEVAQSQVVRLELLCGDIEAPLARLRFAEPAGWWAQPHPASIVVPVLLWLGAGGRIDAHLRLGLRRAGGSLGDFGWIDWLDEVRSGRIEWQVDGPVLLDTALAEIERLLDAVVEGDARGAYTTVARLVAAGASACRLSGRDPSWLAAARARHPRRRALVAAIDRATLAE